MDDTLTAEELYGFHIGHRITVRSDEDLPPKHGGPVWAVRGLLAEVTHHGMGGKGAVRIIVLVGDGLQRVTIDVPPTTPVDFHVPRTNV